jgi:hypothetical protein
MTYDNGQQFLVKIAKGIDASGEFHEYEFVDAPGECGVKKLQVIVVCEVLSMLAKLKVKDAQPGKPSKKIGHKGEYASCELYGFHCLVCQTSSRPTYCTMRVQKNPVSHLECVNSCVFWDFW